MSGQNENLQEFTHAMKRDWDDRARHDAKWFINTLRFQQTEEEFDKTGVIEVDRLVLADLPLLTQHRDPGTLRLLEIGCGSGRMTTHLAKVFGEVVGVDVSGEMIRQAQERLAGVGNVQLHETNGVDFALFPDESFDLVLSAYVFQHVPSSEVIASNIQEAWRVLKPGGVFKFQTNSITALDFEGIEKDTWIGASFPGSEIRKFACGCGAHLISIFGAGSQYCWTTIRKKSESIATEKAGDLSIIFYGRTVAAQTKTIPTGGEESSLTVIVTGLDREAADCNSVVVEVDGEPILPRYVGSIGRNFEDASKAEFGESLDHLTQIEIGVPAGLPSGIMPVKVYDRVGGVSAPVNVEFVEAQPIIPKIGAVMNAHDDGLDVHARGEKSKLKILVEGLNEAADTGNVRVQIGERIVRPSRIVFIPGNGLYEVDAQLPDNMSLGAADLRIYFGNLQSPCAKLEIK